MHIDRVRCYHYDQAFAIPFDSLQVKRSRADSVILRLDSPSHVTGFGESAPRPYVTGEDTASVWEIIRGVFAPILFAHSLSSYADAAGILLKCEAACRQKGITRYHSALGAVDLALLDLLDQTASSENQRPYGPRIREKLTFSASVPFLPLNLIEKFFPLLSASLDIRIIKILIDDDLNKNVERVELIRRLAGPDRELRLEANGKLHFHQVVRQLDHLQRFDIAAIEQPLPPADIVNFQKVRRMFDIAVIADESLVDIESARQLIKTRACDVFNIKISKCGGIFRAKAIADLAKRHGINCHIGTHVGETEILGVPGRQLAHGLSNFDAYGGGSSVLFSRFLMKTGSSQGDGVPAFKPEETVSLLHKKQITGQSRLMGDIQTDECLEVEGGGQAF